MIRRATFADMSALTALISEGSRELLERYETPDTSRAILEGVSYGLRTNGAIYVEDKRPGLTGFCAWTRVPLLADGEVAGLGTYVLPELRGSGVASKLRSTAERHCIEQGHRYVTGIAALGNEAARASCEKAGFRPVGIVYRKDF